jgi:glucose repression regulatory protein TUP1
MATLPPPHTLYPPAGPSSISIQTREPADYQVTLPPINAVPKTVAVTPEELNLQTAAPEFKKEGSDWFAVFNPKIRRTLDINLTHTLTHARSANQIMRPFTRF